MIGVLAAIAEPERFAKLVLVSPSPRYIDDGDYVGGFSRTGYRRAARLAGEQLPGVVEAMAPVIMGNPDRPELGDELTASFCRTDPDDRPPVRPGDVPVRQPRRPARGHDARPWSCSATTTPSRRCRSGTTSPTPSPVHVQAAGRHRALPEPECAR